MYDIYIITVSMPLLLALLGGLFGRYFGKLGVVWLYLPGMLISVFVALNAFCGIGLKHNIFKLDLFVWFDVGLLNVVWGVLFDSLSVTMIFVVTFISFLVHLYSFEYMGEDPHLIRFMCYLSLFTFFMLALVVSPNYLQLFFGWEGVGLSSYLLINFWFSRIQANKAALKAMLMNRIGDSFFGIGIMLLFYICKTVDFGIVFSIVSIIQDLSLVFCGVEVNKLDLVAICFFFGAVGKSAQLGLHSWLPDATEGPTPVSALIHAATMVTAGVFLLVRSSPLLEYCPIILNFIVIISAITIVFGSSVGMFQNDIKRVVAYSTTSQLGYMVLACGLSAYNLAMFHLVNHAFFKALLFLCSGAIIHALSDEQDMRRMGGLVCILPFIYISMLIGSLALAGLPFLSGYYSKEVILEVCCVSFNSMFGYWLGAISTFFTVFYSFRLLYWIYYSFPNGYHVVICNARESSWFISISLFILIIGSIFIGYLIKDLFVGFGTDFWGNSISILSYNLYSLNAEFLGINIKLMPLLFSFLGFVFFFLIYYLQIIKFDFYLEVIRKLVVFFTKKWFFDKFYNVLVSVNLLKFSYNVMFRVLDRGVIEWLGPYGLKELFLLLSSKVSKFNSGYLYHYFLVMFVFIVLFCLYNFVYFAMDVYSLMFYIYFFFLLYNYKK